MLKVVARTAVISADFMPDNRVDLYMPHTRSATWQQMIITEKIAKFESVVLIDKNCFSDAPC